MIYEYTNDQNNDLCNIISTINEFKFETKNELNIIHLNIQSIRNKIDDIEELILAIENKTTKKVHVIALSEIWIYENENKFYNLNGYNAFFSNRKNDRSGGCCFFVHKDLETTLIKDLNMTKAIFL